MSAKRKGYPDALMPCFRCGKRLKDWSAGNNQPFDALEFTTRGHYPSSLFDPGDASELVVNLCDDCVRAGAVEGRVFRCIWPSPRQRGDRPIFEKWQPKGE